MGWAWGNRQEHGDDLAWDAVEVETRATVLEQDVIPELYRRNEHGISTAWVARRREGIPQLTPRLSASRQARGYTEQQYLPFAVAYGKRAVIKGVVGKNMVDSQQTLKTK